MVLETALADALYLNWAIPLAALGYAIFGSSRQLFVGPSSTVAALSAATVAPIAVTTGVNPVGEFGELTLRASIHFQSAVIPAAEAAVHGDDAGVAHEF